MPRSQSSGRPAVLAVDVGGTTMKGAVVTIDGGTLDAGHRPTGTGQEAVEALIGYLADLSEAARARGLSVVAAGVVTPGIIDERTGTVLYTSNLGWRDLPLRSLLAQATGLPVVTGHDVRAAGRAEQLFGAARGVDDFMLVPIGTGVAAALVTSGRPVTGRTGAAGEFGHIPVVPDGEACICGQRGCLEVYASGAGLARRYAARTGERVSARTVVARLQDDEVAAAVWADAIRALALGLVTSTLLLDPGVFVLGGGFTGAGGALFRPLRAALADGLAWRAAPPLRVAELGPEAGRIGAAALAFEHAGMGDAVRGWPVSGDANARV
jgi:glucokinase